MKRAMFFADAGLKDALPRFSLTKCIPMKTMQHTRPGAVRNGKSGSIGVFLDVT